ncbi:HET-domain-containing protein [Lepidopterella palustris CBS 459.81]|uniref:HET-domain-containing protein n=1 Tax=Lepidopterella palustris CBS 459.81 TaxID=1314670 RepID=A0A8E2DZ12_9PEZI|nr:HET-domain-containing protein [Lepidopterella palustris CBS 459.81]
MFCEHCQLFCGNAFEKSPDSNLSPPSPSTEPRLIKWKHHRSVLHRTLDELQAASQSRCQICRILWCSITAVERDQLPQDSCTILELDPSDRSMPVLSMEFEDDTGQSLLPKRMIAMYAGKCKSRELAITLYECAGFNTDSTGSDSSFRLALYWLHECLSKHTGCPRLADTDGYLPSRVIDVGDESKGPRLFETTGQQIAPQSRRYVALSHCWGTEQIITTTSENLFQHLEEIPFTALSRTFQHAVTATRKLGFRFIWIDSLCILQDSKEDWDKESVQMCDIYRKAVFTIASGHAHGGAIGCFVERDGLLQLPFELPPRLNESVSPPGPLFTPVPRQQIVGIQEPPLYGRSWVLQEQILSPRMLIYEKDMVRWECLSMHGSESSPEGGLSRYIGFMKSVRSGIQPDRKDFFVHPEYEEGDVSLYQHQDWCYAVMDFTHRGMTQAKDRLIAIAGIAEAVQRRTKNAYLAGLWRDQLALGLLWNVPFEREYTATTTNAYTIHASSRHEDPIAPSWSWASVTVPVVFPVPEIATIFIDTACKILDAQVEGVASKQTGKVVIQGHVRQLYVRSMYSPWIQEAYRKDSKYSPEWERALDYNPRLSHPNEYFMASLKKPMRQKSFQPMPGSWRPDEMLDSKQIITFIALAILPAKTQGGQVDYGAEHDVLTIGLVPTGRAVGEYRRVGWARWTECAWFGYNCNPAKQPKSMREIAEASLTKTKTWFGREQEGSYLRQLPKHKTIDYPYLAPGRGVHEHPIPVNPFPNLKAYHSSVEVKKISLTIV